MKNFLFVTTLTPSNLQSDLRKGLFDLYKKALLSQTYSNWEALLIGEHEKQEGKMKFIKSKGITKSEKLIDAYNFILEMREKPDYIIRLDDDDIISPYALENASELDFDCYADLFHSFYELTTATASQQKRTWLPNTIIHKYVHGMAEYGNQKLPLFATDHSQTWHLYYKKKKIVNTNKKHPLYLRVISPTTISSDISSNIDDALKTKKYNEYLLSFGKWKAFALEDFFPYKKSLMTLWENHTGKKIVVRKKNFFDIF